MDGFKEPQGRNRGGNLQRNGKFHSDLERKREERKKRKRRRGIKAHRKKEKKQKRNPFYLSEKERRNKSPIHHI